MTRIAATFDRLRAARRAALVPFVTAGDPTPAHILDLLRALVGNGADVVELGVPFSDPMADGPTIQRSSERALRAGTGLGMILDAVKQYRREDDRTPIVLMGYANPVEHMGVATVPDFVYQRILRTEHSCSNYRGFGEFAFAIINKNRRIPPSSQVPFNKLYYTRLVHGLQIDAFDLDHGSIGLRRRYFSFYLLNGNGIF